MTASRAPMQPSTGGKELPPSSCSTDSWPDFFFKSTGRFHLSGSFQESHTVLCRHVMGKRRTSKSMCVGLCLEEQIQEAADTRHHLRSCQPHYDSTVTAQGINTLFVHSYGSSAVWSSLVFEHLPNPSVRAHSPAQPVGC